LRNAAQDGRQLRLRSAHFGDHSMNQLAGIKPVELPLPVDTGRHCR
jgi:hypothetical protein